MQKLISPPKEEVVVTTKDEIIMHTIRLEEQIAFAHWIIM